MIITVNDTTSQKVLNDKFMLDKEKYQAYSQPWMTAGNATGYVWFLAMYSSGENL